MSNYFRKLPNLDYPTLLKTKQSNNDYIETKNLFRRVKIREDLFSNFVVFDQYKIIGDERPDNVAEKVYGDDNLDWVILMSNNIIDVKNEWPMTQSDLNTYINEKYTQKELSHIHHYETIEFRDRNNQLLVPAGKVVDESFSIEYYLGESGLRNNGQLKTASPIRSVNNYENEVEINDKKRTINVIKEDVLGLFLKDFNRIMKYDKSSQYVNRRLKKTENIRIH
tara:strand:- start:2596 stop:3267 length:672 start_codon:yes stop_codon:yes gene_type:complete